MNLRTIEKKLSKSKRRSSLKTYNYYCQIKGKEGNLRTVRKRGDYFLHFRRERTLINILSKSPPDVSKKEDRTIVRRLYYRTLPFLLSRISVRHDRQVLLDIEEYYYGLLNIINLNRGVHRLANRLNYELRYYTSIERKILSTSESSIEPMPV